MNSDQLLTPDQGLYIPDDQGAEQPPAPSPRRSRKGLVIGLVLGAVVLLTGGTYAAARFGYITLPIPLPGIPNDLIAKSLDALYNTTASETKTEFSISVKTRDSSIPSFFPTGSGASANETNSFGHGVLGTYGTLLEMIPENIAINGSVAGYSEKTSGIGKVDTKVKAQATVGETDVDFDFDVRLIDEKIYTKINTFSGFPNVDATAVLGQWYTTGLDKLDELQALTPDPTETNTDKSLKESRQRINEFLDIAQKHQLFTTKKNYGTEIIEGVAARHTSHALDSKQVVPFFEEFIAARQEAKQDVTAANEMLAELKKADTQVLLEKFSQAFTIDLWLDKKAKLIKKIGLTLVVVPPASSEKYKNEQFVIAWSSTIMSSGQTKAVEVPTDTKPLEELMTTLYSSSQSLTENSAPADATKIEVSKNTSADHTEENYEAQFTHVNALWDALSTYSTNYHKYPASLSDLVQGLKKLQTDCENSIDTSNPNSNCLDVAAHSYSSLKYKYTINTWDDLQIKDTYTRKEYVYSPTKDDYQLEYYIYFYPGLDPQQGLFADGKNTSTKDEFSIEGTERAATLFLNTNANSSATVDTDGDGLGDANEKAIYLTDPTKRDTDIDGISDFNEVALCETDPLKSDSDDDTYGDRDEIMGGYNPIGPGKIELSPTCVTAVREHLEVTVIP